MVTYAKGKMIEPVIFLVPLTRTILVFYLVPLSVHVSIYPSILHSRVHVVTFFWKEKKGEGGEIFSTELSTFTPLFERATKAEEAEG